MSFDELTDEILVSRYQGGDTRAFEILLGRHERPIFNYLLRYVGNRATAEELLQETFLRVIKNIKKYKQTAKFTTWLYTIARNLTIDHSRRQKHRRHRSLDAPVGGSEGNQVLQDRVAASELTPDRNAAAKRIKERVDTAIQTLSEEQREVFLLREFQGLSFRAIADIVGTSENTIKSRMRYALEKLRLELDDYKEEATRTSG